MKKEIISILCVILLVVMGSGCTSSENDDSTVPNETHAEAKNVVVLSSEGVADGIGNYVIKGIVQNNNDFGVAFVSVNATGYDADGNIVDQSYTYVDVTDLDAGAKSEFTLYLEDPDNKIVKYVVSVLDADKSLYKFESSSSKFPLVLPDGMKVSCPSCGSFDNVVTAEEQVGDKYLDSFKCNNCGYTWDEKFSTPAEGTPVNG